MSDHYPTNLVDPSPFSVIDYYSHKNILITGCTGYLGKVILEKLLRSIPEIGRIYVLIREKKGLTSQDRCKQDILDGICFKRLKIELGVEEFNALIAEKVVAISGDIASDRLGLRIEDQKMLIEECDAIIHSAADVSFDKHFHDIIEVNYNGSMRVLDLAKQCKRLSALTYISTVGANLDKLGLKTEKIYIDKKYADPQKAVDKIMAMPKEEVSRNERSILGDFSVNYILVKNWSEKNMIRTRGGVPLIIVRPAQISNAWKEPFPSYVDQVQSLQALIFATGTGILNYYKYYLGRRLDLLPVDISANHAIIATAFKGSTFLKNK